MQMNYIIPNGNCQSLPKETFGGAIFQINASSHFFRTSSDGILAGTDGILAGTEGILASINDRKEAQKMSFQAEITIKININN